MKWRWSILKLAKLERIAGEVIQVSCPPEWPPSNQIIFLIRLAKRLICVSSSDVLFKMLNNWSSCRNWLRTTQPLEKPITVMLESPEMLEQLVCSATDRRRVAKCNRAPQFGSWLGFPTLSQLTKLVKQLNVFSSILAGRITRMLLSGYFSIKKPATASKLYSTYRPWSRWLFIFSG